MTASYWRRATHPDATLGTHDVVVVGAGIAGTSAALHLERRGLKVLRVERGPGLGSGASSRNAGFLMRGAADNYEVACTEWGRPLARQVWRWTEENLDGLQSEGIAEADGYRAIPSCLLALEPVEAAELRRSVDLLLADGFKTIWLDPGDRSWTDTVARASKAMGALVNPADASANSVKILELLAGKLNGPLVPFADVIEIRQARAGSASAPIELVTTQGVARAARVLVCTNAYAAQLFNTLAPAVLPRRGQMLAIRDPRLRLDMSYYANRGYEYFRQHADGTVVVGGCRREHAETEVGYEDRTTPSVQRDLESFAASMLGLPPREINVIARWSGVMGFTTDGLPLIGPIAGEWPANAVWFCGGCTGHGMSLFYRISQIAVSCMLDGGTNPLPLDRRPFAPGGHA
jgi:gamma-glutamylputrescine oxidase